MGVTNGPAVREFFKTFKDDTPVEAQENTSQMRAEYIRTDSKSTRDVDAQIMRTRRMNYKRVHDELLGQYSFMNSC